jgi:pentatricopeptide repeat protein
MSRLLEWGGIQMSLWGNINLVDMYAKYGSIQDASRLFYKMPSQDVV